MDMNLELKRYASGFVYFIVKTIDNSCMEDIDSIILFGSVAQNRAGRESDVDIFIDSSASSSKTKKLQSRINKIKEDFLLSNEGLSYKERGVYNEIRIIVGNLSDWTEMKKSISIGGIVLYGPYRSRFERKSLHHSIIFFWETDSKNRGAFLNKLYGYRMNDKVYKGLIQKLGGTKIGKSAALIPSENIQQFIKTLEHYKINYKTMEVFV